MVDRISVHFSETQFAFGGCALYIHKKKSVTKKQILEHLGWGVRISFSGYRNRLRNEPTIKFTKNRYEVR